MLPVRSTLLQSTLLRSPKKEVPEDVVEIEDITVIKEKEDVQEKTAQQGLQGQLVPQDLLE